jgi:hypothetical protein
VTDLAKPVAGVNAMKLTTRINAKQPIESFFGMSSPSFWFG